MKKRLLAILLTICMVAALLPTAVFATESGSTLYVNPKDYSAADTYETIASAITAAKAGDTIKLLDDVTVADVITVDKELTLDLNGKTITNDLSSGRLFLVQADFTVNANGGSMVILDTNDASTSGFFKLVASAKFTLNGGTYSGNAFASEHGSGSMILYLPQDDTTKKYSVNLNDVTVDMNVPAFFSSTEGGVDLNVKGGNYNIKSNGFDKIEYAFAADVDGDTSNNKMTFDGVTVTSPYTCVGVITGKATFKDCNFTVNKTNHGADPWTFSAVSVESCGEATIESGTYTSEEGYGTYVCTSGGTINIKDGEITGGLAAVANGIDNGYQSRFEAAGVEKYAAKTIITNGVINGDLYSYGADNATITVNGGYVDGKLTTESDGKISVTGGKFSTDPSEYCVEGKTGIADTNAETYLFTVGKKKETEAAVVQASPTVTTTLTNGNATAVKTALENNKNSLTVNGASLDAAVKEQAQSNTVTTDEAKKALTTAGIANTENAKVVVKTYQAVEIVAATDTTFTIDITPYAQTYATTAATDDEIVTVSEATEGKTANAVALGTAQKLKVTGTVTVSVPLPENFPTKDNNTVYVKHITDSGATYVYTGTVDNSNVLTFTNPDGFSYFVIGVDAPVVSCNNKAFDTLQDAVDVVKNNDNIVIDGENCDDTVYVGRTVTFTINDTFKGQVVASNIYTTITTEDVTGGTKYVCVYTAPSVPVYRVVVNDAEGGKIKASASKAAEGATIVLTPVADDEEGELETLAVVDEDGNAVTLTKRANGTYSFVMPAKAVTVTGTFTIVADPEEPDEDEEPGDEEPGEEEVTVFTDVDEDAYYAEAVAWAVANEITKGTSETTFSPDDDCTRAQVVTFLWRYAGKPEPTTTENPFTDVEEDTDYYKAILWAYENGITTGTSETTFSPEETCTRAQVVTFLWRYEGELTYEEAETFTDVAEDAYYAKAVAWAVHEWITKGTGDGQFSPDETCTRGQVVTFLYRDTAEG